MVDLLQPSVLSLNTSAVTDNSENEMLLRKKDIKPVCDLLANMLGLFSFVGIDGRTLYETPGFALSEGTRRTDVMVDGYSVGQIAATSVYIEAVAALFGLYLLNISEKKKMVGHTLQKYREMSFLAEINKIMSASVDVSEILSAATARVHEIIRVETCSVMVADSRTGKFILKAISGRTVNEPLDLKTTEGIAGRVL